MIVILTQEQKDILDGAKYDGVQYFAPIKDLYGNWVISKEEIDYCTDDSYLWVKDLVLSEFNPPLEI